MKILVVNGKPRSGKDTFCEYAYKNRGLVYPVSTIDKVKQIALSAGWHGEKDKKSRKFLSDLKDIMTEYNDMPRQYVLDFIQMHMDSLDKEFHDDVIFLVQAREPVDIVRWIVENDAKTLLIKRDEAEKHWGNHADDMVNKYCYNYYLHNNGTKEEWACTTTKFIDDIRKQEWESHI